jgi:hypothetical protein
MYTILDDQNQANKIKAFMDLNPSALRKDIERQLSINWHRLKKLEKAGMVILPRPLTKKKALSIGTKLQRSCYG